MTTTTPETTTRKPRRTTVPAQVRALREALSPYIDVAQLRRLAAAGETVRVYVPYGTEWYGYLMRRLAERPQNLSFFVKSLISKK